MNSEISFKDTLETLKWSSRGYQTYFLILISIGFLGRGCVLLTGNLIAAFADFLIARESKWFFSIPLSTPENFLQLTFVLLAVGFSLTWIFRVGFSNLNAIMMSRIHDQVVIRVNRYPMIFFDQTPVGKILTRFASDYGNAFRLFGGPLAEFLSIIFDLVLISLILIFLGKWFIPFVILAFVNYLATYMIFRKRLRRERELLAQKRAPSIAHFAETLQGATTIRVFDRTEIFENQFDKNDKEFLDQKLRMFKTTNLFLMCLSLVSVLNYILLGLISWNGFQKGVISPGTFGLGLGLVILSSNSIQMFFDWLAQFEDAIVGLHRLDEYLKRNLEMGCELPKDNHTPYPPVIPIRKENDLKTSMKNGSPPHFNRTGYEPAQKQFPQKVFHPISSITFKHVWFRYHDNGPWILKDLSLQIPKGKIGLIGSTGSGKTSFTNILTQIYPIQSGSIEVGPFQLPITQDSPAGALEALRSHFEYVTQEPFLLQGTLRENIDPENYLSDEKFFELLEKIEYYPWLKNPNFDILERGKNLSAGERQLIQLARCLARKKSVLILDEPTSLMDPSTEKIIQRIWEKEFLDHFLFIVAHKLYTLEQCDSIIWIEKGSLRHFGPPKDVLNAFQKLNDHLTS